MIIITFVCTRCSAGWESPSYLDSCPVCRLGDKVEPRDVRIAVAL